MKRVLVIGSGGAGKSYLTRELGSRLGIEVIHLDVYFWKPGWVETPADEWQAIVEKLIAGPSWVMDGNYGGTMPVRFQAADAIIFLDISRWICLWRAITRMVRDRGRSRPDLPAGCPERFDWPFLKWIWFYPFRERPVVLKNLTAVQGRRRTVILRSGQEVRQFLERPLGMQSSS
jgi:adenylate kinase family enzyme